MKKIAVLGSTGSIGTQTLEVVRRNRDIQVTALAAGSNAAALEAQIREFSPKVACVYDRKKAEDLKQRVRDLDVKILSGMEGLIEAAVEPSAGIVVTAVVGMIGIRPTIAAIEAGKDIALANKETLVTAGHIIMPLAKEKCVRLLPVDSEHAAIFQCLNGEGPGDGHPGNKIYKILLTASGGPFRGWNREQMREVKPEDALKHPNWAMGRKITIDSSTMVNKGLEVMEARWLFGVEMNQIQVVIQPQSIIHSMVEFEDGAILAQLGSADMCLPIQYALTWPERTPGPAKPLDLLSCPPLTFQKPDPDTFRCLGLALECAEKGGTSTAILNGANEAAVGLFLEDKIGFLDIPRLVERALEQVPAADRPSLDDILEADQAARGAVYDSVR